MGEDDGSDLLDELKVEIIEAQAALDSFEAGFFAQALDGFEALARKTAASKKAVGYQFLVREVRTLIDTPPSPSWDGVITLTEK
jgi:hypothetical protein